MIVVSGVCRAIAEVWQSKNLRPGPVHGNVSVGGLGWQQGEAHLLRGDENTRELHHAGVRPLLVGSNTSLNITLHTHS